MKKYLFAVFCFFLVTGCSGPAAKKKDLSFYAIAETATPVLRTHDFRSVFGGEDGSTIHLDSSGLIREVEFIALPGTVFKVKEVVALENQQSNIYKVIVEDFPLPSEGNYFIDSRFVKLVGCVKPVNGKKAPSMDVIIERLLAAQGSRYIWGGNYKAGVPQMLDFYPPSSNISEDVKSQWILQGVDCSGLLYESTDGFTPRNTGMLVDFGEAVKIAGLDIDEIIKCVEPLDIIVWKGHVIIILNNEQSIESRLDYELDIDGNQDGVKVRQLKDVLAEIMQTRKPVDEYSADSKTEFVIRRWIN